MNWFFPSTNFQGPINVTVYMLYSVYGSNIRQSCRHWPGEHWLCFNLQTWKVAVHWASRIIVHLWPFRPPFHNAIWSLCISGRKGVHCVSRLCWTAMFGSLACFGQHKHWHCTMTNAAWPHCQSWMASVNNWIVSKDKIVKRSFYHLIQQSVLHCKRIVYLFWL